MCKYKQIVGAAFDKTENICPWTGIVKHFSLVSMPYKTYMLTHMSWEEQYRCWQAYLKFGRELFVSLTYDR